MQSNVHMIKKLRNAINGKGEKLLYNTSEFYSESQQRAITIYIIKKAVYDEKRGRNRNIELFHSASQIQIVLFLRDYWYKLTDQELPTDNETWNNIRRTIECLSEEQKVEDTNTVAKEKHTTAKEQKQKPQSKAEQLKQVKRKGGNKRNGKMGNK